MPLGNKSATEVTEADLQSLITNGVSEGTTIDYKKSLYSATDSDKREFLFDVSAFANASGGYLIIGIEESAGIPTALAGIRSDNIDADLLHLENLLRDCVKPRIPNISIASKLLGAGGYAVIVHVPKSFSAPHMIEHRGHIWFYSRHSSGKYRMDVDQLRSMFLQTESMADRIRSFRDDRLKLIIANATPVLLEGLARLVVHVVPMTNFSNGDHISLADFSTNKSELLPYEEFAVRNLTHTRYNLDGFLTYMRPQDSSTSFGYLQAFRNGSVESVDSYYLNTNYGKDTIFAWDIEDHVISTMTRITKLYRKIGINPPVVVLVSLTDVAGYKIPKPSHLTHPWDQMHPIDRSLVLLPEVIVTNLRSNPADYMRPTFDAMWNAAGWPFSINYDENGQRRKP